MNVIINFIKVLTNLVQNIKNHSNLSLKNPIKIGQIFNSYRFFFSNRIPHTNKKN